MTKNAVTAMLVALALACGQRRAPSSASASASARPPLRKAQPKNRDWNCPFPKESDNAEIDAAFVVLDLSVDAAGNVTSVHVLHDPGYGFAREAERCARTIRFDPALGADGRPEASSTGPLRVRFERPPPQ